MKKIVLYVAIGMLSFTSVSLFAQPGRNGQRQQEMQSFLKDSVKLSGAQMDSVTAINKEYQPKMRDIFMDQSAGMDDKRTKMESLQTEMEARYKSAGLTDAQVQQIHDHQARMREQMRSRMGNGGNQ